MRLRHPSQKRCAVSGDQPRLPAANTVAPSVIVAMSPSRNTRPLLSTGVSATALAPSSAPVTAGAILQRKVNSVKAVSGVTLHVDGGTHAAGGWYRDPDRDQRPHADSGSEPDSGSQFDADADASALPPAMTRPVGTNADAVPPAVPLLGNTSPVVLPWAASARAVKPVARSTS